MKRKSTLFVSCLLSGLLLITSTMYAASNFASVTITRNDLSAESSAVGISRRALYKAVNSSGSSGTLQVHAYACWTGWPYSLESTHYLEPSARFEYVEPQDKDSNFYIRLDGYYNCYGKGNVRTQ